jgi:hypothetical protein
MDFVGVTNKVTVMYDKLKAIHFNLRHLLGAPQGMLPL